MGRLCPQGTSLQQSSVSAPSSLLCRWPLQMLPYWNLPKGQSHGSARKIGEWLSPFTQG